MQHSSSARYIAKKLFEFFAHRHPSDEMIERLAHVVRSNRGDLAPMLKNLFRSEEFYSSRAMGQQVKSPVELMVGLLRDLGTQPLVVHHAIETPLSKSDGSRLVVDRSLTSYETLDLALQDMGMQLMEPP